MSSSGFTASRENFLKIKMEEQTVPSAGFSPQPEYMTGGGADSSQAYYGNGMVHLQVPQQMHHQHQQQQQQHINQHQSPTPAPTSLPSVNTNGGYDYNTSFDTFDLSLLGDYDDRDMATVPSPSASCWSPFGAMEPTTFQQMSFYAASPPEIRAFSPDCKPFNPTASTITTPAESNNASNNNAAAVTPPPTQPHILENTNSVAALSNNNNNNNTDDANLAHHHHHHGNHTNILLRQCLEDNTFIEKYNFKPLDLPITSLPSNNEENGHHHRGGVGHPNGATNTTSDAVGSATLDMNLEPVFSLAYETIISDIQHQCRQLGISPDPMQWSVENVHSWLSHSLTSFSGSEKRSGSEQLSSSPNSSSSSQSSISSASLWNIDGQRLCALSEQEFHQRDPLNGEKIFANLELLKMWKCTGVSTSSTSSSVTANNNGPQPFDFGQLLNHCSPSSSSSSIGTASPAPSFIQDDIQSSADICNGGGAVIKMEVDSDNMQGLSPSGPGKFSGPGSVETSSSSSSSSLRHSDDDDEEEDEDDKPISGAGNGATVAPAPAAVSGTKSGKPCGTKNGAHIHLWQFLKELLASGQQHGSCIRWLDQSRGVFKIEDSVRVARLWGIRKNRPAMNYDKLSRSIRQYYRKGIMRKTERSQRLVYQFCHPYGL